MDDEESYRYWSLDDGISPSGNDDLLPDDPPEYYNYTCSRCGEIYENGPPFSLDSCVVCFRNHICYDCMIICHYCKKIECRTCISNDDVAIPEEHEDISDDNLEEKLEKCTRCGVGLWICKDCFNLNSYKDNYLCKICEEESKAEFQKKMKEKMKDDSNKPIKCPKCGSERIFEIIYGYLLAPLGKDAIWGGCEVTGNDPSWQCMNCNAEIYEEEI